MLRQLLTTPVSISIAAMLAMYLDVFGFGKSGSRGVSCCTTPQTVLVVSCHAMPPPAGEPETNTGLWLLARCLDQSLVCDTRHTNLHNTSCFQLLHGVLPTSVCACLH